MRRRLLLSYLSLAAIVLLILEVPLGISAARRERDANATSVQREAVTLAALSAEALEHPAGHDLNAVIGRYGGETGARAIVVDTAGAVVAAGPAQRGSDEAAEPVVADELPASALQAALAGKIVSGREHDDGGRYLYVATPVGDEGAVHGAVVVTYPAGPLDRKVRRIWAELGVLALIVLGASAVVGLWLARSVTDPLAGLERASTRLGHGDLSSRADEHRGPPEVQELARSFNEMATRLGELLEAQRRFVADASHQLRTPLTALRLRLETIDPDAPAAADLEAAEAESQRLSRIVDGLLALVRAEGVRPERSHVDAAAVVRERQDAWAPLADERGIALEVAGDDGSSCAVTAVPGYLDQILDNLIANAIEATPWGRKVTLAVRRRAGAVEVHVTDEGPGMTAAERARAFDRFWRGDPRGRQGNSGLGLAIVQQLAVACGGEVVLDDAVGGGLDATVRLSPSQATFPAERVRSGA
jgi:signal transduction histidine kinase